MSPSSLRVPRRPAVRSTAREPVREPVRSMARPPTHRLARLVVVIDEFATLKTELPEFLDALVGVAQRGRSLGVHLILATQRPSGVVSDQIRANTNIRITLRVQDPANSRDVIELPDTAALDRRTPGRALVRLGRHDVTIAQTAYAGTVRETGESAGSPVERLEADLLTPLNGWASERGTGVTPRRSDPGQASELQGRVEQVAAAAGGGSASPPHGALDAAATRPPRVRRAASRAGGPRRRPGPPSPSCSSTTRTTSGDWWADGARHRATCCSTGRSGRGPPPPW